MELTNYLNPATIATLQTSGYIVMLGLMIVEGPIVTFIGGFLATSGFFFLPWVMVLGFLGDIIGDIFYFSLGYRLGATRFGKNILEKTLLDNLRKKIDTNLLEALMIIKFTPNLAIPGLTTVGAMHVPIKKYALHVIPLCTIFPSIFGLAGYYSGHIIGYLPDWNIGIYLILLPIVIGILVLLIRQLMTYLLGKEN